MNQTSAARLVKPLRSLWVYKCNASEHSDSILTGNWQDFFARSQPSGWGGSTTMKIALSLKILWERIQADDLILCWQTDKRRAVGLCRVARLDDWVDQSGEQQRDLWLELLGELFDPPVPLLDLKKTNEQLAAVRCFNPGPVSTLYETTADEAETLLLACGMSEPNLRRLIASASTGPPIGSSTENE